MTRLALVLLAAAGLLALGLARLLDPYRYPPSRGWRVR